MAYHLLVNVMEAPLGREPLVALRNAVVGAFHSYRPISQLHAAGWALAKTSPTEGALERHMGEQIAIDTNPLVRCTSAAHSANAAFEMHRAYEAKAQIAIRTISEPLANGRARILRRIVPSNLVGRSPNVFL